MTQDTPQTNLLDEPDDQMDADSLQDGNERSPTQLHERVPGQARLTDRHNNVQQLLDTLNTRATQLENQHYPVRRSHPQPPTPVSRTNHVPTINRVDDIGTLRVDLSGIYTDDMRSGVVNPLDREQHSVTRASRDTQQQVERPSIDQAHPHLSTDRATVQRLNLPASTSDQRPSFAPRQEKAVRSSLKPGDRTTSASVSGAEDFRRQLQELLASNEATGHRDSTPPGVGADPTPVKDLQAMPKTKFVGDKSSKNGRDTPSQYNQGDKGSSVVKYDADASNITVAPRKRVSTVSSAPTAPTNGHKRRRESLAPAPPSSSNIAKAQDGRKPRHGSSVPAPPSASSIARSQKTKKPGYDIQQVSMDQTYDFMDDAIAQGEAAALLSDGPRRRHTRSHGGDLMLPINSQHINALLKGRSTSVSNASHEHDDDDGDVNAGTATKPTVKAKGKGKLKATAKARPQPPPAPQRATPSKFTPVNPFPGLAKPSQKPTPPAPSTTPGIKLPYLEDKLGKLGYRDPPDSRSSSHDDSEVERDVEQSERRVQFEEEGLIKRKTKGRHGLHAGGHVGDDRPAVGVRRKAGRDDDENGVGGGAESVASAKRKREGAEDEIEDDEYVEEEGDQEDGEKGGDDEMSEDDDNDGDRSPRRGSPSKRARTGKKS
ncbi:hypothetical protein LTR78_009566 [Recurvomyces mirabilis]|uniref:Uncharacterized protein n=1 Tax=Recurvomyces mirabilis TaxID=574656 RepID=A0AAE0WIL0_9PEZI|nr:hypothetical protein LTR78_009566 [Recurvomyces mirabilis]